VTRIAKVLLLGTCLLAAPVALWLAMNLWAVSPLRIAVLPAAWAAGYWLLRRPCPADADSGPPKASGARWALLCWLISAAAFVLGGILRAPELVAMGVLVGIAASITGSEGTQGLKRSLVPLALMASVVPLPFGWEATWTNWASGHSVRLASSFLDLRDVLHAVSGEWIELPDSGIPTARVTAGVQGIPLVVAGSILLAAWRRRPHWHLILLALASAMVAMGLNIAAITLGIEWAYTGARDVWQQPMNSIFLLGFLFAASIFVFCFDHLLAFFSTPHPLPAKRGVSVPAPPPRLPAPSASLPASAAVVIAMAMAVPCAGSLRHFRGMVAEASPGDGLPVSTGALPLNLPEEIRNWTQQNPEDAPSVAFRFSDKSSRWEFRKETLQVNISAHAPFRGFPSVEKKYTAMGWHILSSTDETSTAPETPPFRRFSLRKPRFERAEILCAAIGPEGQWISSEPPAVSPANLPRFLMKRTREFLAWIRYGIQPGADAPRAQMLVHAVWTGDTPFQPDDQFAMIQLFNEARQMLAAQLRGSAAQP
jgi:hypothetical protein